MTRGAFSKSWCILLKKKEKVMYVTLEGNIFNCRVGVFCRAGMKFSETKKEKWVRKKIQLA